MILSDKAIKERLKKRDLIILTGNVGEELPISVCESVNVQPASFDLRLGTSFATPRGNSSFGIDTKKEVCCAKCDIGANFVIKPKEFILATTKEYIRLPNDLTAFVEGRSSIGRLGLFVQNAGWVDPGFEGEITLELFNASDLPILLYGGMRIAQLVFAELDRPCENPYNGKYQKQTGATASRLFKDGDLQNSD